MARTKTSSTRVPPDDELRPYLLDPTAPLDWLEIFGNARPVEVEVGSGKGLFLMTAAARSPARNFFGIEIARKFARFAAGGLAKHSITNARVACADARRVLFDWIADASVTTMHVYFPDPWWKRRHRRRRIFTADFVAQIARALEPGGELRIASDVEEYFGVMRKLVAEHAAFSPLPAAESVATQDDTGSTTNFERKYRKAGKPIFHARYKLSGVETTCVRLQPDPMTVKERSGESLTYRSVEDQTAYDRFLIRLQQLLEAAVPSERKWQDVLDAVLAHLQCTVGTIHRLNPATGLLELRACTGVPDVVLPQIQSIPIGKGMAGLAAQRGEPVQVCDLQRDESGDVQPNARQIPVHGAIALPMFAHGELRGVLGVAKHEACEFAPNEVSRLVAIATCIGTY